MKIHSDANVELLISNYRYQKQKYLSTTAIVFFNLTNGKILDKNEAYAKVLEFYPNLVIDAGMPKIHGEVIVSGTVRPQNEIPMANDLFKNNTKWKKFASVKVEIGTISNRALVFFEENKKEIKLSDSNSAPNILEYHGEKFFSKLNNMDFTEKAMDDPERLKLAGTYGKAWLKHGLGSLPDDYNFAYNNVTSKIWQINGAWPQGIPYVLEGVGIGENDDSCFFKGHLPYVAIGVVAHRFKANEEHDLIPTSLNLDTIRFLPDANVGVMIWHGLFNYEQDFDTLVAIKYEDFVADSDKDKLKELSSLECANEFAPLVLKLILDLHKEDVHAPQNPQYDIKKKVVSRQKESRELKHKRYCKIYEDYYSYYVFTESLPLLMPYTKDRIAFVDKDNIIKTYLDNFYKSQDKLLGGNKFDNDVIYQAYTGNILDSEKNFNSALSALLSKTEFLSEEENATFEKLVADADLQPYTVKRYLLGYNPKEYIDTYRNWGVDQDGEFIVPKGVIIPTFIEKTFVSGVIRPHGFMSSQDEFYLPGGGEVNGIGWFNHISEGAILKVITFDIWEALRLNEETEHYLDIIALNNQNSLKEKKLDNIEEAITENPLVIVLAPEAQVQEYTKQVQEYYPLAQIVSLDKNQENEYYHDLKTFLLDKNVDLDEFFKKYSFFPIVEPTYLPGDFFEAAFDKKMEEKFGLTPGQEDYDAAAIRALDKQKEEVLKDIPYEHVREKVAQSFDEAKARLKEEQQMDFATVQKIALEKQKENLKELYETHKGLTPEGKMKVFGTEDTESWFKEREELLVSSSLAAINDYAELEKSIELTNKQWEEQAKIRNESIEEQVASRNLTRNDLIDLKNNDILNISEANVDTRDLNHLDLSYFNFKSSSFYKIDFTKANLNNVEFVDCSFTDCSFDSAILNHAKFTRVVFLKCHFSNDIWSNNEFSNCDFLDCDVDSLTFSNSKLYFITLKSGDIKNLAFLESDLNNLDFNFVNIEGLNISKGAFKTLKIQDSKIKNILFEKVLGTSFSYSFGEIENFDIVGGTHDKFQISNSQILQANFYSSHFSNVYISESFFINSKLGHSVYDDLLIDNSDLTLCNFEYMVAKHSTLSSCNLREANFLHANLLMSNLSKSLLGKANFREANLFGCDFTECKILDNDFTAANLKRTILQGYQKII